MADEPPKGESLSDSSILKGDTDSSQLQLSNSTEHNPAGQNTRGSPGIDKSHSPKLPNGVVPHAGVKDDQLCDCDEASQKESESKIVIGGGSHETSKLCLPASTQETLRKSDQTDSADSGVHSGTENGSDAKSSSSSPGLSTESSVQDLCEKHELNKCDSIEPLDKEKSSSNDSDVIDHLADSVSNTVITDTDRCDSSSEDYENGIQYLVYKSEAQMPDIMRLITKDLSEPYSIYTYRYFIHNWPKLCFLAMEDDRCVGAIVCKLDMHKKMVRRGYIAMLAVDQSCRRKRIGSHLVLKAIRAMIADDCDEVVLETEITNEAALRLYENLGFVRDKRLFRYYLNGVDALRLKLWLR